jgi:outer membrane receptor protein involved in Fe transport
VARTKIVDVTAGARVDAHSSYGVAVSPRVVLTQAWDRAHFKLGAARAYRAPGIVQARSDVGPEHSTTLEAEVGVGPTSWAYLTVSGFDATLDDVLVYRYSYDPLTDVETEGYVNLASTGTRGGEAELRLLNGPFGLVAGWAFYTTAGKNDVPDYAVPGEDALLAAPQHKGVLRADLDPFDGLVVGATATVLGPRHAVVDRAAGASVIEPLPAAVLLGAVLDLELPFAPGLAIGVVAQDLLDENPPFVQAYDGGHLPLPSTGREIGLHVAVER